MYKAIDEDGVYLVFKKRVYHMVKDKLKKDIHRSLLM